VATDAAPKQVGDLKAGLARGDPEDGREPLVDAPVVSLVATAFDGFALLRIEVNQLHRMPSRVDPRLLWRATAAAFLSVLKVLWAASERPAVG
jgi:hypothetical protein